MIFGHDEALGFYDSVSLMEENDEAKVECLLNFDDGIMHRETIDLLEAVAVKTVADLPANLDSFDQVAGNL